MTRMLPILALAALLLLPPVANAGARDAFRKAKLQSAVGELTITESRCATGSADCGKTKLTETFRAGPKPRTRSAPGQSGFPLGVRIAGKGSAECSAESPATTITGPDGSVQFLSGASRLDPGSFDATRIVASAGKRGVRIAWLEPLAPALDCTYFDEPDTIVGLPVAQRLPSQLVSPAIGPRALGRSRFSSVIAGSKDWAEEAADGTQVTGHAIWRLRLVYAR